jgi:hypothetical protein
VNDTEELGTIDWLLIEFRGKEINGELVPHVLDLVDRRLIRLLDVLIVLKRDDGTFESLRTQDLDPRIGRAPARLREPLVDSVRRRRTQGRRSARHERPDPGPGPARPARRTRSLKERTRSMPGLIGGMARTAVVAGTATAVSNRVSRRQAERWGRDDQSAYAPYQYAAPPPPQYVQPPPPPVQQAPPPPPPAAPAVDPIEQLTKLGQLRDSGILTEEEFQAQKAKILGS